MSSSFRSFESSSYFYRPSPQSQDSQPWLVGIARFAGVPGMEAADVYEEHQARINGADGGDTGLGGTSIHITALDGIVNVNSLFTLAVFVGLAWNPSDTSGLASGDCAAGSQAEEDLVSFHVFAFSTFLFSSLVALCLKQAVRIVRPADGPRTARVNRAMLRGGILASAVGSVFGCGFLMLALVNMVQIKLGKLGCASASVAAIIPLVTLVPAAMLIYICIVFYAFTR